MKLPIPIVHFMIIPILIFVMTSMVLYLSLLKTSSRFRNATLRIKIALDIGLSHFIFTVFIITLGRIIDQTQNYTLGMLYSYANVFEYPFFLITSFVVYCLRNILPHEIYSVIVSFISFSIIGSLFYGYFALFIGYLFGKIKESMGRKTIILIISTILFGIMLLTGSAVIFPTRALLFMETIILKSGASWESPLYIWFYFPVHQTVLSLLNYGPLNNNAISDGMLKIIQDDTIDDLPPKKWTL